MTIKTNFLNIMNKLKNNVNFAFDLLIYTNMNAINRNSSFDKM